jgi:AcrR family transcriptional regulator
MTQEKKDLRYMKTEQAIRKAFHELLLEKDMKRITVRELVERAQINKTTFYAHYETMPDLIDTLETENINYIIDNLDQVQLLFEDPDRFIDDLYRNLLDCRISTIGKNGAGSQSFIDRLKSSIGQELKSRNIDAAQYGNVTTLLVFILHGLLGVANMGENSPMDLEMIKDFVRNGLKPL